MADVFVKSGYNAAIRALVSKFVDAHREQVSRSADIINVVDINIEV